MRSRPEKRPLVEGTYPSRALLAGALVQRTAGAGMSEIAGQTGHRNGATAVVNESYSFACMRCGHGWEQSYEIEHHLDAEGNEFVMYVADGRVVPSPLSRPTCLNCDNHVVRIMRAGQVSSVQESLQRLQQRTQ